MFGREMTVLELELAKTNAVERLMEMVWEDRSKAKGGE